IPCQPVLQWKLILKDREAGLPLNMNAGGRRAYQRRGTRPDARQQEERPVINGSFRSVSYSLLE
ncbi:MAG: hypothetical protein LBD07_06910, partial [Spirochaetaceae bacterium]|nr:hypothetical protein [Spirochaetaceae bacterium]